MENWLFLQMPDEQNGYVRFDPYAFVALMAKVVVGQKDEHESIFRNGMNVNAKVILIKQWRLHVNEFFSVAIAYKLAPQSYGNLRIY